jgi:2-polyprenyl-6-methoxyphenol hydroxylase-like FAD-dependent oxidoreductase
LLLAQSLKKAGIPFTIFERDASFSFRAQGYRLLLNSDTLDAVESILDAQTFEHFWDKCGKTAGSGFATLNAVTGEEMARVTIGTPGAKVGAGITGRGGRAIGIARGDMRQVFAEGMEEHIQWSSKVTGYELTGDGVRAVFADGTRSAEGCMLVGALLDFS